MKLHTKAHRTPRSMPSPALALETKMIPFSVLDLSPIRQDGDAAQAFRNTLDLARHAEGWNYGRYWLAEHHNMTGIANATTAVKIGYVTGTRQPSKLVRAVASSLLNP